MKKVLAIISMFSIICTGTFVNHMAEVAAADTIYENEDGSIVKEYSADEYNSYRQQAGNTKPESPKAGYIFAGWYSRKECGYDYVLSTSPANGAKAYAKFVDENVLSLKLQFRVGTTAKSNDTDIRLLTTVDSLDYRNVGFELTLKGQTGSVTSQTVYRTVYGYKDGNNVHYLPTEFSAMSQYFMVRKLTGLKNEDFDEVMTVTPKWTTLDGTVVTGISRSFSINQMLEHASVDFFVEVEEGREPVVLQITDPQIIDSSQQRSEDRLGSASYNYWLPENKNARCYDYLTELINNTNPDLILVTGDIIYGEFDDDGSAWIEFINFMDTFKIPWAPIFGNHENESKMGVEWQCEQLEASVNSENGYCLFKQRTLTGNGNYTVGIKQGGKLKRVFFMLDSNGCGEAQNANAQLQRTSGFGNDQIAWYEETAQNIKEVSPNTKFSMAFHIQTAVFGDALEAYGYDKDNFTSIDVDTHPEKKDSDFGYLGEKIGGWDTDYSVWNGWKKLGVDSVFVGHEHANSASVVYEGVRLQFGQKSSTYDSTNFVSRDGNITAGIGRDVYNAEVSLVGGTVMKLSEEDGNLCDAYIYLCVNDISKILDEFSETEDIELPEGLKSIETVSKALAAYRVFSEYISDTEKAKLASWQAKYQMLYDMTSITAFTKNTFYPGSDYVTLTSGEDATYGNVLKATFNSQSTDNNHLVINYQKASNLAEQLSGYEKVCFYVYNPRNDTRNLMCDFGGGGLNTAYTVLAAKAWTKVEVPVADFISGSFFGVLTVGYQTGAQEFLFSAIWAESPLKSAQPVIDMIDRLPAIADVEGYHKVQIQEAREAYDALSEVAQLKVTNYATLTALETAYQAKYQMLYDMTSITAFTKNTFYPGSDYVTLTSGEDATYGNVLKATFNSQSTDNNHLVINYQKASNLAEQLSGYEKVCFYVYNPRNDTRNLMCDFGGGGLNTAYTVLAAKAWTKVEVPVADFISGSFFGVLTVGYQTGAQEFLFSAIWAESPLKSAQSVSDMINALAEVDSVEMPAGIKYIATVNEVATAYEALSETAKTYISAADKAKLTAWKEKLADYIPVVTENDLPQFLTSDLFNNVEGTIVAKKDAEYGSFYEINITGVDTTNMSGTMFFTMIKDLKNYNKLYFYVYNPLNSVKTIGFYSGNDFAGSATLQPGWNLVSLDGTKVTNQFYMIVYFADTKEVAGTWKVTTFYGVK